MNASRFAAAVAGVSLAAGLSVAAAGGGEGAAARPPDAQSPAATGGGPARVGAPGQEYDRNALLLASRRAGAAGGPARGEEIFYMRCWICHSEYVIVADHFPAPSLRDLYGRYGDEAVRAIIRSGSPGMPTYGEEVLSEADLDDLVSFLRESCGVPETGGGCFDEHNPPPNPFYQYEVTGLERPRP